MMPIRLKSSVVSSLLGLAASQDPYGNVTNPTFVYEVGLPLPNYGVACASQVIVNQEFTNSYGKPVYVNYEPPQECANFTHVTADLYLASYGYQYDRLMHLFKDGIEVWRPSSPEPVGRNITSHEAKDLTTFTNLFRKGGLLEFDLANILEGSNQGPYYAELKLNYYQGSTPSLVDDANWFYNDSEPATRFYAVVANQSTITRYPAEGSIPVLPRNVTRAVLNVFASGNSQEEFWYSNDASQKGPTRLIEVVVDGNIAGIADPFPVVYTGGVSPGLWQPLMGLKASDVPSYVFDISPFLPLLWDHETSVQIYIGDGNKNTQSILSNWIISSSLLTWDAPNVEGTGEPIGYESGLVQEHEHTKYSHNISNSAYLTYVGKNTSWSGISSWVQHSQMENQQKENDTTEFVQQHSSGWSKSLWKPNTGTPISFERSHYYPIELSLIESNNSYRLVSVNRSYDVNVSDHGKIFWEKLIQESIGENGLYTTITDVYTEGYHRHAEAVNGSVIEDTDFHN